MKRVTLLTSLVSFVVLVAVSLTIVNVAAQEKKHKPKPLTEDQKMMMKNTAMRHMDTYMGSKEAMMKLPKHLAKTQKNAIGYGRELFNSKTALSTNGQACGSCHPGGGTVGGEAATPMKSEVTGKPYKLPIPSLVGSAATFPKYKVPNDAVITVGDMANNCIMMFMAAQPLAHKSREYKALTAYVSSLSNGDKVSVGEVPEMMKKMMEGGKK